MVVVYASAVALVLAASAWSLERALMSVHLPVRWAWIGALALSVALPATTLLWDSSTRDGSSASVAVEMATPVSPVETMVGPVASVADDAGKRFVLLAKWKEWVDRALASIATLLLATGVTTAWIVWVWAAASVLATLILGGSVVRLNRRARRWPGATLLGRRVRISPDTGPATVGMLRPLILIPAWARELPRHELDLVLRHESEHARARDNLALGLGLAALVAFPWNPMIWWQVRRLRSAVEVDCDRRVLRDGASLSVYGALLVRVGTRGGMVSLAVPTIAGSTSQLERRLTIMMMRQGSRSVPSALPATTVGLLLAIVACTSEPPTTAGAGGAGTASEGSGSKAADFEPGDADLIAIQIDREGSVRVNGVGHSIERLAEVVAPLRTADAVVSIEAHAASPYRAVADVQEQLREAGLVRLVFSTVESEEVRPPARSLATLLAEEPPSMILPDRSMPAAPSLNGSPNLLAIDVLATGDVAVRRGAEGHFQRVTAEAVEGVWRWAVQENPNLMALVKVHPDAGYGQVVAVLDALHRANATRFSFQVAE